MKILYDCIQHITEIRGGNRVMAIGQRFLEEFRLE